MLSPPLSALLDNEIKVCIKERYSEVFEPMLTFLVSYLDPRQSSAFGRTCVLMTFKTQMTSE